MTITVGFINSFLPILKRFNKFKTEIFILCLAAIIAIISLLLYFSEKNSGGETISNSAKEVVLGANSSHPARILVDIAGAVENPGVYETGGGARLKDAIILAGGLSANAERDYVSRNFNLAKLISDQEKIYVPSKSEITAGLFAEPQKILDYTSPVQNTAVVNSQENSQKININSATLEELDTLPGIGKTTAEKIIQNRPYKNVEELVTKKIVKKNLWEQIKSLISAN